MMIRFWLRSLLFLPNKQYLSFFLLMLFVVSCASPKAALMVPELTSSSGFTTNKSIRKIVIKGDKKKNDLGLVFATNQQILDAVRTTLRKSGMFNSVDTGEGDVDLYVVVKSQKQDSSFVYRAKITITYRFADTNGEILWLRNYESEFSSNAAVGHTRSVKAREGSVRENIAALIEGLKTSWGK